MEIAIDTEKGRTTRFIPGVTTRRKSGSPTPPGQETGN